MSRFALPSAPAPVPKVLVVEDDPLLRLDAIDMIEDAGLVALAARDADAALRLLEGDPSIAILFTDVDMPGSMDGLSLAHAVRSRWPRVAILVTSAHLRCALGRLPENGQFLPKPYRPASILAAIAQATLPRTALV